MQMIGSRTRAIAAAMALTMGLSACAGFVRQVCGPDDQTKGWADCRDTVIATSLFVAVITLGASIAILASGDDDRPVPAGD